MSEASPKIWDISPPIRPGIPVWPGDTDYQEERTWQLDDTCPVNVSRLTLSTHTGAHADAPLHYDPDGLPIGSVPLDIYLGPCQVLDLRAGSGAIRPEDLISQLSPGIERVLIRSYETAPLDHWDENFRPIDPETIQLLNQKDVRLIGTDTPSLDPQTSKEMAAHMAVKSAGMAILEGLVLDQIEAGTYELIALPLKLANLDAAPVRAVLRELDKDK